MRAKLILPAIAVASTLACAGISSGAAFATTAAEAGFEDEILYSCVLTALEKTSSDTITDEMLAGITGLNCITDDNKIMSTAGIEKLTNLASLQSRYIHANSIDLSHNTKLVSISLTGSNVSTSSGAMADDGVMSELLLPETDTLTYLSVNMSRFTHLDVSKNPKLKYLYLTWGSLESIDLSNNLDLERLSLFTNKLTSIDVTKSTKLTSLNVGKNSLESINLSRNPDLKGLYVQDNKFTSLDLRYNTELNEMYVFNNNLTELNLTNNKKLEEVCADAIDVYTGFEQPADAELGVYDLSSIQYAYYPVYSVAESEKYTYDATTHILTATDPETFDRVVALNLTNPNLGSGYRLHLYAKDYPEEPADEPEADPESLPETDTSEKEEPEAVPSNPKTSDPIVVSILLGLAFGLAACLVSVKLTRRR